MKEFKRLLFTLLLLTFLGGIGVGAWIGTLSAAPRRASADVDRRVEDWRQAFGLDKSQERRLRAVLARYDAGVRQIREETTKEQFRRIRQLEEECRREIRESILDEDQRREYDSRRRPG